MDQFVYPVNYDFSNNWDIIKPFLDHPDILKAIRIGVTSYISNFPLSNDKYKKNTCPARYSSRDGYEMLMMRWRKNKMEELETSGQLLEEYVKSLDERNKSHEFENNYEDYSPVEQKRLYHKLDQLDIKIAKLESKIMKPYFEWNTIKYNIESYCLYGSCFSWAPTFELTLAKLVCPDDQWEVMSGKYHATVINKSKSQVFDLLYWACDGRLEHHIFNDDIKEPDETLGGKMAFANASA